MDFLASHHLPSSRKKSSSTSDEGIASAGRVRAVLPASNSCVEFSAGVENAVDPVLSPRSLDLVELVQRDAVSGVGLSR